MTLAWDRRRDSVAGGGAMQVPPLKWAEVDVAALRDNAAALVRHVAPDVAVMAMVKANGYGHGAVTAARAALAGGVRWLGVSSPEEALQLRAAGVEAPILDVGWSHPSAHAAMVREGVDITVVDGAGVDAVRAAARAEGREARVHAKVDTGMGRLGARLEDADALLHAVATAGPEVRLAGVFTQLADADGDDVDFTLEQHARFLRVLERARELAPDVVAHCCNSAAMLRFPEMHHDLVRPGIAFYGYPPPAVAGVVPLRPALTALARVAQVKTVQPGESVGYGRIWKATAPARIATVAAGYADGVMRAQSNRGCVVVRGVRCPIAGRVSMDQVTVDVSAVPAVAAGDEAVLVGGRAAPGSAGWLGADEVGAAVGTIAYEVLCALSARVPRIVVGEVHNERS